MRHCAISTFEKGQREKRKEKASANKDTIRSISLRNPLGTRLTNIYATASESAHQGARQKGSVYGNIISNQPHSRTGKRHYTQRARRLVISRALTALKRTGKSTSFASFHQIITATTTTPIGLLEGASGRRQIGHWALTPALSAFHSWTNPTNKSRAWNTNESFGALSGSNALFDLLCVYIFILDAKIIRFFGPICVHIHVVENFKKAAVDFHLILAT